MISEKILAPLETLLSNIPTEWDGKKAILQMRNADYKHWKQMEWIGFYFQFLCENMLSSIVTIPGPKFGRVTFDGLAQIPWDFKVHPNKNPKGKISNNIPANDKNATLQAIEKFGGVGLILAVGDAVYDDQNRNFQIWHQQLKGGLSRYEKERTIRTSSSRLRKTSFTLTSDCKSAR